MENDIQPSQPVQPVLPVQLGVPSQRQQSWGVVISIVVIVSMIVIGAFYVWGNRIAEQQALTESVNAQ